MTLQRLLHRGPVAALALVAAILGAHGVAAQKSVAELGGAYGLLDRRQQHLVDDWVTRFNQTTGQKMKAEPFYDTHLTLSTKTTFDAVSHALMTTTLTDASDERLGNPLDLVERVDSVKGQVIGARGDRQFRMYVRLRADALDLLERAREFRRGPDNTIYHKGYPINYRQQGGVPSIQFSVALDGRGADIDVDYRASGFPAALFNGHLTAANSDVRAGRNYDRHTNRWIGFQNWWQNFFGVRMKRARVDPINDASLVIPNQPRAGKRNIDAAVDDFLTAWLVEGDVLAAMSYVSERAYSCLAEDGDDPLAFDRGTAPFQLLTLLRDAHDALGTRESLVGLTVGVRLTTPGLKVVTQPHHAQFVIYAVPDDIAAAFDCASDLTLGDPRPVGRSYGNQFGATFYIAGPQRANSVALLWKREQGYWKIVSWRTEPEEQDVPTPAAPREVAAAKADAEPRLVDAARDFLESWLIRKDYDAAYRYLSPKSYACYDLIRSPDDPPADSIDDAGARIRAGLERSGNEIGNARSLDALLSAAEPGHPAIRVLNHPYSGTFSLSSLPNVLAGALDCAARARGERVTGTIPREYGKGFEMSTRFRMRSGDAPVLNTMWANDADGWRIVMFNLEVP